MKRVKYSKYNNVAIENKYSTKLSRDSEKIKAFQFKKCLKYKN